MLGSIRLKNRLQKKDYVNKEYRGANIFPITDYDENYRVFISNDGYANAVWECQPLFGRDEKTQELLTKLIDTDFPNKSFLQVMMFRSPDVYRSIGNMLSLRSMTDQANSLLKGMVQAKANMVEQGTLVKPVKGLNFKFFDLRIVFTLKIPMRSYKKDSGVLSREDGFRMQTYAQRFESSLKSYSFMPTRLNREGYIRLMSAMVNWGEKASWRTGGVSDDPNEPINEQILDYDNDITLEKDKVKIGSYYMKSYSAKRLPMTQYFGDALEYIGDLSGTNSGIHYHYAVTVNVYYPDRQALKDKTERGRLWTINQAKPAVVKMAPILGDKKHGFDVMHESMKEGHRPVKMSFNVTVFAPSEDEIVDAGEQVDGFFKSLRFMLMEDDYSTFPIITNHFPGGACPKAVEEIKRYKTLTGEHVAVLAAFFGEWKGTGTPHMMLTSRNGQTMSFSMHDSGSNMNMLIAATSGGGKSFFTNDLIMAYLSCGFKVWAIDVGRSYEKACLALDQNFISFGPESDICLNPFPLVVSLDGSAETRSKMLSERERRAIEEDGKDDFGEEDALVGMLCTMASPEEKLTTYQITAVRKALTKIWMAYDRKTTVKLIRDELMKDKDQRIIDVGEQLHPFAEGSYSKYFIGDNNLSIDAMFTVLELEELKGRKHLQSVVLFQLIYQIQQEVYLGDRSPKLVVIDESWDLLQNGGPEVQMFLEHAYRRFRKYGAAVLMCTQSLMDLEGSACGEAILSNSATKCLFRHDKDVVNKLRTRELISLPAGGFDVLQSVHTVKHVYSEVFIKSEHGIGVGRLYVPEFQRLLYSTDSEDVREINGFVNEGYNMTDAINAVIKRRAE